MENETLEELAERLYPTTFVAIYTQKDKVDKNKERRKLLIEGAKWQQEQDKDKYSEEEVLEFANWCRIQDNKYPNRVTTTQQLFEQFKKK